MADKKFVDADFVRVRSQPNSERTAFHLYFGDEVVIESIQNGWTKIIAPARATQAGEAISGFVKGEVPVRATAILKASMIDVQQGDGMVLETPSGKIILIDGGDNQLFARHLAARFRARLTTRENPLPVEAIIVTHGDADHFAGLTEIRKSETLTGSRQHKRVFIHPKRILHNGIVKGPGNLAERAQLGATVEDAQGKTFITTLYEDIRQSPVAARNLPFKTWISTIDHWSQQHGPVEMRRAGLDKNPAQLFDFLQEDGIKIELHGPEVERVTPPGGQPVGGLRFLKEPPKTALLHELEQEDSGSLSASHTINGHSVAFRLNYGNVRFLFTGDLNKESMARLEARLTQRDLEAEILKTPHHGSADFDLAFLRKVRPVVSLISSGDESARKEYIHPRSTLMNALGAASRNDTGLVFCTELTAFFEYRDACYTRDGLKKFFKNHTKTSFTKQELEALFTGEAAGPSDGEPAFFAGFDRTQFGLIEIRTDGERVLIFTHSGKDEVFEAYRFLVKKTSNGRRTVTFADVVVRAG
jgi:beta-lactamase superfamily II metal-dependent hydrolase